MKHIATLLFVLGMVLLCGVVDAHQDTRLKFEDGKIIGLPVDYLPASFDVEELSVTIAAKKLKFPYVFHRLLRKGVNPDPFDETGKFESISCSYTFSASWYHESLNAGMPPALRLPPYILISIFPTGRAYHFELLIDMESLKFLQADLLVDDLGLVPINLDDWKREPIKKSGEQGGAGLPATAPESKPKRNEKPQPESKVAPR